MVTIRVHMKTSSLPSAKQPSPDQPHQSDFRPYTQRIVKSPFVVAQQVLRDFKAFDVEPLFPPPPLCRIQEKDVKLKSMEESLQAAQDGGAAREKAAEVLRPFPLFSPLKSSCSYSCRVLV